MFTLLKLEVLKLIRARSFLLSFIALTTFVALMLWGFYSYAERKAGEQVTAQFKYTYESKSYFNGLTFALYSVMFSFSLLIPIFVAMTAGAEIAGERQTGDATHDLRATGISGFAAALEIPGGSFVHLLVGGFLY